MHTQTETVIKIPIADPSAENKNILVHKQEKVTDAYCWNRITTVENGKAIVSILNISESIKDIKNNKFN